MNTDLPMREIRRRLSWVDFLAPLSEEELDDLVRDTSFVRLEKKEEVLDVGSEEQAELMLSPASLIQLCPGPALLAPPDRLPGARGKLLRGAAPQSKESPPSYQALLPSPRQGELGPTFSWTIAPEIRCSAPGPSTCRRSAPSCSAGIGQRRPSCHPPRHLPGSRLRSCSFQPPRRVSELP
jgi:hypothetical protein